ncbi:Ano8, partial [Symbiodinium sp. KB8]
MALLFPSIVGLATFIGQQITFTLHLIWLPGIAIAAAVWSTLWGEFWKRQQSTNAMEWGMTQFEDEETLRAAFMNSTAVLHRRSLVHGKPEYYSSPLAQRLKSSFSISLISIAIGTVVAVVVGLFFTRILLTNEEEAGNIPAGYGGILSSAIAAVQIQITSFLYKKMVSGALPAVWLNDFENHATETQYRDSLILKSAIFET